MLHTNHLSCYVHKVITFFYSQHFLAEKTELSKRFNVLYII